jgi:hypothetical protein
VSPLAIDQAGVWDNLQYAECYRQCISEYALRSTVREKVPVSGVSTCGVSPVFGLAVFASLREEVSQNSFLKSADALTLRFMCHTVQISFGGVKSFISTFFSHALFTGLCSWSRSKITSKVEVAHTPIQIGSLQEQVPNIA